ncbi:unnamed protein product [Rhodiola kirilowii]
MEDAVGPASRWWVWLGVVTGLAGSRAGFVWIAGWGWMRVLAGLLGRLRVWLGRWTALSGAGWGRRAGVACRNRTGLVLKTEDIFLICSNAMQYNSPSTVFFRKARAIQELAKRDFDNLRKRINRPSRKRINRPSRKRIRCELSLFVSC